MKKMKFSESQIVNILKEAEAGVALEELVRQHGFSKASFYKWKSKYSGMSASDLKRLKELEEENRRLKQMYANLSLEHAVLKDIIKKTLKSEERRALGKYTIAEHDRILILVSIPRHIKADIRYSFATSSARSLP